MLIFIILLLQNLLFFNACVAMQTDYPPTTPLNSVDFLKITSPIQLKDSSGWIIELDQTSSIEFITTENAKKMNPSFVNLFPADQKKVAIIPLEIYPPNRQNERRQIQVTLNYLLEEKWDLRQYGIPYCIQTLPSERGIFSRKIAIQIIDNLLEFKSDRLKKLNEQLKQLPDQINSVKESLEKAKQDNTQLQAQLSAQKKSTCFCFIFLLIHAGFIYKNELESLITSLLSKIKF